jgi:glyoxylase-like metal-dependent hydrolase (beta-lactamase superfamily II)
VGRTVEGAEVVKVPLSLSNAYLVKTPTPILIDTGTIGDTDALRTALSDQSLSMRRVGLVILTHAHADHAGLAAELQAWGAKVVIGEGDAERAERGKNDKLIATGSSGAFLAPFIPSDFPDLHADVIVTEGHPLDLRPWGLDAQVVAMPGHTAGSIVVLLPNHTAFVGDMMRGGMLTPGSPTEHYFHADRARNRQNIQTLMSWGVETFYLGHGGPVTRDDVAREFHGE